MMANVAVSEGAHMEKIYNSGAGSVDHLDPGIKECIFLRKSNGRMKFSIFDVSKTQRAVCEPVTCKTFSFKNVGVEDTLGRQNCFEPLRGCLETPSI
jgi:hypothetical protein